MKIFIKMYVLLVCAAVCYFSMFFMPTPLLVFSVYIIGNLFAFWWWYVWYRNWDNI